MQWLYLNVKIKENVKLTAYKKWSTYHETFALILE